MINYIKSSYEEMANKVTWPSYSKIQSKTVLVTVFSVIFSLSISGIDYVIKEVIDVFFSSF